MTSKSETVLTALFDQITAYFADEEKWTGGEVKVTRNSMLPEYIPPGGFINVMDGDPGAPDYMLGGSGEVDYAHRPDIDLVVEDADAAARDATFAALVAGVGAAMREDRTLGGTAHGYLSGQPRPTGQEVEGAGNLKMATLSPEIHYSATTEI